MATVDHIRMIRVNISHGDKTSISKFYGQDGLEVKCMHESRTNGINVSICFATKVIWFRGQLSAWMKRTEYKFPFASLPKQFGLEANFVHEANTEYNLISFDTLVGKNSGVAFTMSLANCPWQNDPGKLSLTKCPWQIVPGRFVRSRSETLRFLKRELCWMHPTG